MTTTLRSLRLRSGACVLWAAAAGAQTTPTTTPPPAPSTTQSSDASTRPATTTFYGDTGLWFVPTAEVLRARQVVGQRLPRAAPTTSRATPTSAISPARSASASTDRAEIFGSFLFDTRIDRDVRPLFRRTTRRSAASSIGYPLVHTGWTGDNVGDFYLGAKVNLLSE